MEADRLVGVHETVSEAFGLFAIRTQIFPSSELLRETVLPVQTGVLKAVSNVIGAINVVFTAIRTEDKVLVLS